MRASPAVHVTAPEMPCAARAANRNGSPGAKAKTKVDAASAPNPPSSVCRAPIRSASQPAGAVASRRPAAYDAKRAPVTAGEGDFRGAQAAGERTPTQSMNTTKQIQSSDEHRV